MIMVAIILTALVLPVAAAGLVFSFLVYNRLSQLIIMNSLYRADDTSRQAATAKLKKPALPVAKQEQRGHNIVKSDNLVDMADLPWEDGYAALEELGR